MDCGAKVLHLVGKGDVQIQLPPGNISTPLRKAPSGHMAMAIDENDKVTEQKGGVAEASLQLHTNDPSASSGEQLRPMHHDRGSSQLQVSGGANPVVQGQLRRGDERATELAGGSSSSAAPEPQGAGRTRATVTEAAVVAEPRDFSV